MKTGIPKPTSGHQERQAKVADRKKRRQQNGANKDVEHMESMHNSLVILGFPAHHEIGGDFNIYDG